MKGGAVYTSDEELATIAESIRDWGRDCYCQPGRSNTCGKRFGWCLGTLPEGYDHKYTYSHFGYNLKMTDMQAAVGVAQLRKLPGLRRRPAIEFRRLPRAALPVRRRAPAARGHTRLQAQLVRVPRGGPTGFRCDQGQPGRRPRGGQGADPHAVRRQPGPTALLRRDA